MNKRTVISTIMLVALLVSGCGFQIVTGSGKIVTETRDVSGFTSITLNGIGDVYVTQGQSASLTIEAEDNLVPYFETVVQGSTLTIGQKPEYTGTNLRPTKPIKFTVTLPELAAVTLAGSGNFIIGDIQTTGDFKISLLGSGDITTGDLEAANVNINLAGSGDVTLGAVTADAVSSTTAGSGNISYQKINATTVGLSILGSGNVQLGTVTAESISSTASGSGDVTAAGEVTDQTVQTMGSSDYHANALKSQTATIHVSGSGDSQVSATGTLNVTILGSGDVAYSGSPKLNASIAGSGKVNPASQ